jgi:hypothetical protein
MPGGHAPGLSEGYHICVNKKSVQGRGEATPPFSMKRLQTFYYDAAAPQTLPHPRPGLHGGRISSYGIVFFGYDRFGMLIKITDTMPDQR